MSLLSVEAIAQDAGDHADENEDFCKEKANAHMVVDLTEPAFATDSIVSGHVLITAVLVHVIKLAHDYNSI